MYALHVGVKSIYQKFQFKINFLKDFIARFNAKEPW